MENVFFYYDFPYISKIICFKIIIFPYNNPLIGYLEIKKTRKLIIKKYFRPTFC